MIKDKTDIELAETAAPIEFESEDELNETINSIIEALSDDIAGYQQAYQMYNSDFFDGEDPKFKKQLCAALNTKFQIYKNAYWIALASE
jgi:hypothetical protein